MLRSPSSRLTPLWIAAALALAARGEAATKSAGPLAWTVTFQYGLGNLDMEGDSLGRDFGQSMRLRMGHIISHGVIAGFDARLWSDTGTGSLLGSSPGTTDLTRHVGILAMTATIPMTRGVYVRAGGGICRVRQDFLSHDPLGGPSEARTYEDVGLAVIAAGGWEKK